MKRKAEITFEIEETTVVRRAAKIVTALCPQCRTAVEMAAPGTIADYSDFSEREIFRLIEKGKIHFIEAERVLVCLDSIGFLEGAVKK